MGYKDSQYEEMYRVYQSGCTLAEVGDKFGITRQAVSISFKKRGMRCRPVGEKRPFITLDERKFSQRRDGYFVSTAKPIVSLHRYVWTKQFGAVPINHEIHHKDGNRENNSLENLECMSSVEHREIHREIWRRARGHVY